MTAGETVDVETLLERRQLTTDKQKSACVAQFAEWIETESDSDLRYPRDWSWVLDQSGLAADLRNRLEPSDEPLAHQAGSAFRKHSYRLQAIRLFGNGIN
ncbi:hypothetical protein [Ferrimicrobium acidiphilum]|jgi:hypothetical protein|uniref:hypothetical protein n=1 Tax=Ferrimicrobium acidiphilum TaxID=121039 RepID=UPI0023F42853|nr:hypothetical protein [Ferrimicrobium acidiphilum]